MLLALETSGKSASICLLGKDGVCHGLATEPTLGSAQTLAPAIQSLIETCGLAMHEIQAIAVTTGPGSFTGLRVGVTLAKTMAYALRVPTIPVDTLEVIARHKAVPQTAGSIWTVLDAYRGELFVAAWRSRIDSKQRTIDRIVDSKLASASEWRMQIEKEVSPGEPIFVVGPGTSRLDHLGAVAKEDPRYQVIPDVAPQASEVAWIGWEKLAKGEFVDPFALMPVYLRGSAAEEKLRSKPSS